MNDRNPDPHIKPHDQIAAAAAARHGITDPGVIKELAAASRALSMITVFDDLVRFARGPGFDGYIAFLEQQHPDGEPCPACGGTHPITRENVTEALAAIFRLLNRTRS